MVWRRRRVPGAHRGLGTTAGGRIGGIDQIDEEAAKVACFTVLFNGSGQPALALPSGFTSSGLPMSVQLVGRRGTDRPLLQLGRALGERLGFDVQRRAMAARLPWAQGFPEF